MRPYPVTTPSPKMLASPSLAAADARGDETIELDEAPVIEQQVESLARGELPFGVLRGQARGAPAHLGRCPVALEQLEFLTHCHGGGK